MPNASNDVTSYILHEGETCDQGEMATIVYDFARCATAKKQLSYTIYPRLSQGAKTSRLEI